MFGVGGLFSGPSFLGFCVITPRVMRTRKSFIKTLITDILDHKKVSERKLVRIPVPVCPTYSRTYTHTANLSAVTLLPLPSR